MSELKDYIFLTKVTQQDLDEGVWDAEHKGLYSKDGKRFLQYMRPKNLERGVPDTFQLKSGVEVICEKAFSEYYSPLTSFVIPNSVVNIYHKIGVIKKILLPLPTIRTNYNIIRYGKRQGYHFGARINRGAGLRPTD